jgi:hypothetical protein
VKKMVPTLKDALVLIRGPLLALLVLAAFSATMQATYEQDRTGAELAQNVLLADHVLNRTCWPGAAVAAPLTDDPSSYRCPSGSALLRDFLETQSQKDPAAAAASGVARLFSVWRFTWKAELLDPVKHSLWMQAERLQRLVKEQGDMAKLLGDAAPRFFVIYADIDRVIQPRPDRYGVLFVTAAYRDQGHAFGDSKNRTTRLGPSVAMSSWFFTREFRLLAVDSLEAAAIEIAREAGHSSKRADDAYAVLTSAVARSTVTIPVVNMQLSPSMAALALLICAAIIQLYASASLKEIAFSSTSSSRRTAKAADPDRTGRRLLYVGSATLCAALPLLTAYWAFDLMQWVPFRSMDRSNDDWFGITTHLAFVTILALTVCSSVSVAWQLASFMRIGTDQSPASESRLTDAAE